jgi:hypothetical protein
VIEGKAGVKRIRKTFMVIKDERNIVFIHPFAD